MCVPMCTGTWSLRVKRNLNHSGNKNFTISFESDTQYGYPTRSSTWRAKWQIWRNWPSLSERLDGVCSATASEWPRIQQQSWPCFNNSTNLPTGCLVGPDTRYRWPLTTTSNWLRVNRPRSSTNSTYYTSSRPSTICGALRNLLMMNGKG